MGRKRKGWMIALGALGVLLAAGAAFLLLYFKDIYRPEKLFNEPSDYEKLLDTADMDYLKNRANILILGMDRNTERVDADDAVLTDTIILATLDFEAGTIDLITIPRDSYVVHLDGKKARINSAFGKGGGFDGDGFTATRKTVEKLLGGIPIHNYLAVDMDGLAHIVDGLGGVPIEIEKTYLDAENPGIEKGECGSQHELGLQKLNGHHFLSYVRNRKGDSDVERAQRQQKAIIDVVKGLKQANLFTQTTTLYGTYKNDVYTDLSLQQLAALAVFVMDVNMETELVGHMMPGDFLDMPYGKGYISYWGISQSEWKKMVKDIFGVEIQVDWEMDVHNIKKKL
ncbi:LCP family protein [Eubacteriales bacterium OttesenSCG-928-M02]|nr:LCP family protein [Eubacteriales bacterium OttesenSCG-928-M02]